ncbi:cysteine desulfurase [Thermosipho melanesiensis]|uniref:Cysteine desulfurase n=2 Tax=Thermosipho melanesiensis TaxID=46541 RepID=A6LJ26_THEM4|nr:SufS family cysteine desulfurase [Thermosipho melanesiensis]ABR29927.1 cysteine desulfurase, SufS subfamily [Thermosipho melanesiensis BI429]APT73135.1 cysteine desulfurase [Thermosipho melanesiensis]OOC38532.1 cysteine desulfurase [Thermosipho melanesiensis]OOC40336.1 cysteine desulfurase [Thermosipho melanesiensis]OOC40600.1 cysteine desulfurase [Thermosipho melanesiensis]
MLSKNIRDDFPVLERKINGNNIVYFDSAASTLKPKMVIEKLSNFYLNNYANVHRAVHTLASESTQILEASRKKIAKFLNAQEEEVIFTSGSTMSLNLVVESFVRSGILNKDDNVLVTMVEHHANFVPWIRLSKLHGYNVLAVYPSGRFGELKLEDFNVKVNPKIVAITAQSNVTGQLIDIKKIREKFPNAIFVVDGAQFLPHAQIDVKDLDIDFLVFSAHKMLGPSGIGVLWGKRELLEKMEPFLYGGEMIDKVSLDEITFNVLPFRFEAGTPNIAGIAGFSFALEYLERIEMKKVENHIRRLTEYALEKVSKIDGVELYGPLNESQLGILSFNVNGVHPHDIAHLLDEKFGIAVRSGHHCAQPLMSILKSQSKLDVFPNSTCRASFYVYNTLDEIDKLIYAIKKVKEWFDVL